MADRYSMLPNAFPGIVQQHQQQMAQAHLSQHQQQPQDSHPPVPGFPDQGPMWQQMQQMQNQFRPQSTGMDPSHVNPQVAELMRNQQLSRQGQQQPPQQQFGMQMPSQPNPPSFLDPSNQQQQQPSQSHPGFQNMGISNPSLQTLNNRTAMLQAFQQPNNPEAHRQIELMGLAHNQQPQNGPLHFANRMNMQAALNGQSRMGQSPQQPPENFLSPSMQPNGDVMRRPSPSHSAPGPTQPATVTRASYHALKERAANLKNIITNQESQLVQLTSQRTRIGDASFMDKVRTVSADLKNRKEHYARLLSFLSQIENTLQSNGQNMNMGGGMPQTNPSWMQAGPSQPQPPFNPNQQQNGQQGGPQAHSQNGHYPAAPPRPGPPAHQFPNTMQPNSPFQQNSSGQEGRQWPPIPPLDKPRFENVYKNFCTQRNLVHNPRMLSIETRPLDLHDLHAQVMLEGGATVVSQRDLWSVIGGRMGFVQFPASDTEPAKSGPGVAQQLAHTYKEYLAAFDHVYVMTVMEQRRKNGAGMQPPMGGVGGNAPRPSSIADPAQMQIVMAYANVSTPELRRRNVPEHIIQFIENNRTTLVRNGMDQIMFREKISAPVDQNAMHPGAQPFGATPPGMVNGRMPQGRPFVPHPGMPMENQQPVVARPSREMLQAAMAHITKLKGDYSAERMLQNVPPIDVPPEQRMEYNNVLEQLHRACMDLDHKLPMIFAVLKKEDVVRRLVIIVQTAIQQRAMISSGSTRFLVTLDTLRTMLAQVQHMNESFATILAGFMGTKHPGIPPTGPTGMQPRPPLNHTVAPPLNPPSIPQSNNQPNNLTPQQPLTRPIHLLPPPKKPPRTAAAPTAPTVPVPSPTPPPVASASTPTNNAPTPRDMTSPRSPKSRSKSKPVKRKQSIKATAPPPLPPLEPVTTAPSPAGSNKRVREDESSPPQSGQAPNTSGPTVINNEPSPPKRQKTEWEGPPSEAIKARAEQVENVKTEEDGAAFLEQMTELFKMAAGNDGQDTITSDFSETLDTIFKGFGASTEENTTALSSLGMGDGNITQPQDGAPPVVDEFVEFFDFSSFGTMDEDDAGSKAETPDLISSSSTNPSPESNAEVDATHQAPAVSSDIKSEDFTDHLRLGAWKEVDGGESAYFNSGQWKWDGSMQSMDQQQPWAIFNS